MAVLPLSERRLHRKYVHTIVSYHNLGMGHNTGSSGDVGSFFVLKPGEMYLCSGYVLNATKVVFSKILL